jgi:hypothetical protein
VVKAICLGVEDSKAGEDFITAEPVIDEYMNKTKRPAMVL